MPRLAILELGALPPAFADKVGGYFGLYRNLLESAIASMATATGHADPVTDSTDTPSTGNTSPSLDTRHTSDTPSSGVPSVPLLYEKYNIFRQDDPAVYPSDAALVELDAILLSGSVADAFDTVPWIERLVAFVRHVVDDFPHVRIIGVCFGHQLLARVLGAPVYRQPDGWELSVVPTRLTDTGKRLFEGRDTLRLIQLHRDIVADLPADTERLASTPVCREHGFYRPGRFLTVQGHPEFTADCMKVNFVTRGPDPFGGQDVVDEAVGRLDDPQDGVLVGRTFVRFLRGEF